MKPAGPLPSYGCPWRHRHLPRWSPRSRPPLSGDDDLRAFDAPQLQALAYTFVEVHDAGYLIGLVFFGLGSTVFAYLWFTSRYIPRALAGLGLFSSMLVAIVTPAVMAIPSLGAIVIPLYFADFHLRSHAGLLVAVQGLARAWRSTQ